MYTRMWVALLAGALLYIVIMFSNYLCINIISGIISIIALYELFKSFKISGHSPVQSIGYILTLLVVLNNIFLYVNSVEYAFFVVFLSVVLLFICVILSGNKINFIDSAITLFAVLYVPVLLSFVVHTVNMELGKYVVWFIFIGAYVTDIFAYIIGKHFGKIRFMPIISPNKTLEGCFAGLLGGMVSVIIYGLILKWHCGFVVSIFHYIILGLLISILAQIGDLSASSIKRITNVKDFGSVMPGHGGLVDRIDSILFVAPIVYFYFSFILNFGT